MDFLDWLKVVGNVIGSIGGIGAIIAFFANWWGNRIAEKISNKEKAQYEQELERLKTQLELTKTMVARYSEQQFTVYNQLWSSLYELLTTGDELWMHAERQKLLRFAKQLRLTKDAVEKGSLFIEDELYQKLRDILEVFSNYEAGKSHLIDLRELGNIQDYEIQQITANRQHLNLYTILISEIRSSFKRQLNVQIY